jgi:DNA-binding response OmpR family regulator
VVATDRHLAESPPARSSPGRSTLAGRVTPEDTGDMAGERILVVDDEAGIRELVGTYLRREGFDVDDAADGDEALDRVSRLRPDLMVLDLRLPTVDGFDVLREVRRSHDFPVIVLSARTEETDKLIGLELGADDYLTKPFSPRELVARVRAVLRRARPGGAADDAVDVRRFDGLVVDRARREVLVDDAPVELTTLEFDLLDALAGAPGRVFTRRQLTEQVWGWDFYGDERIVDVHVRNLRRALGDAADAPRFVGTVRGVGYKLVAAPS